MSAVSTTSPGRGLEASSFRDANTDLIETVERMISEFQATPISLQRESVSLQTPHQQSLTQE